MVNFREIKNGLESIEIEPSRPVLVHTSLSAIGEIQGGAATFVGALLATFESVSAPVFTYKTMVVPEDGPANNGITYGSGRYINSAAEFFRPNMPADRLMGVTAETLRNHPRARRSTHPILSFTGVNAEKYLSIQTLEEPLAPIRAMIDVSGWVVLIGVDHTANTSLHYAERLAERKQFVRWALTPYGVRECRNFPGCSEGFQEIASRVGDIARRAWLGDAEIHALPLQDLMAAALSMLEDDPFALLCDNPYCERCSDVRTSGRSAPTAPKYVVV